MRHQERGSVIQALLAAGILASSVFVFQAAAQSTAPHSGQAPAASTAPASTDKNASTLAKSAGTPFRNHPAKVDNHAEAMYDAVWGVDGLSVKYVEAGEIIRFSYRILDPQKAAILNDKDLQPSLIDPAKGVSLVVPAVENVGPLRQMSTPRAGVTYWMAFSNMGRRVRPGDRVMVKVGTFIADGLIVE